MDAGAPKGLGTTAGISLAAIVTLVATNGEKVVGVLTAFWNWILLVADKMPMGLFAFLAGHALGVLTIAALRHWIPDSRDRAWMHGRLLVIEAIGAGAAFAVVWSQERSVMNLAVAGICAMAVPLAFRLYAALAAALWKRIR